MITVVPDGRFGVKKFAAFVNEELPPYARPVFVRVAHELETTGTFKYRKVDLVKDGFDPAQDDDIHVRDDKGAYTRLKPETYAAIMKGQARL